MKKLLLLLMVVMLVVGCVGCVSETKSIDSQQAEVTKELQNQMNQEIGMPNITEFYEKKMLKKIYELRDDSKLVTYTYTTNLEGKKIFQFKSIGYGLPMSVQFSNPQKIAHNVGDFGQYADDILMPQAEPNGLFMPEGLSATWIMRINEDGNIEPVYMEEEIFVSQSKLPRRLCAEWSLPEDY